MKRLLHLSVLLLLLLSACADDRGVLAKLSQAESLLEEHPDSAYTLLTQCDSLIPQQSKPTRMHHLLLTADATNKLYLPMPSDTLFQEAVDYYDHHGTPNQQLKAHYLLGCIYRDMKEAPQAIQCYYDAVEKADTLDDDCIYTLVSVYGQMATLFNDQIMPYEAISALRKAQVFAKKCGDTYTYIKSYELLLRPYNILRDTFHILQVTDSASLLYRQHGYIKDAARVYPEAIDLYIKKKQYSKAHELMAVFERDANILGEEVLDSTISEAYEVIKGNYFLGTEQLPLAEQTFRNLIGTSQDMQAYRGLLEVFQKTGRSDSIIKYWPLYEDALDMMQTELYIQSMHKIPALYNYTRNERLARERQKDVYRSHILLICVIFFAFTILFFSYWQYRRLKVKKLIEIVRIQSKLQTVMLNYEKIEKEKTLLQTNLSKRILEEQEEMNLLKQQLQEYKARWNRFTSKEKEESLMYSNIVTTFQEMTKPQRFSIKPSKADWENLLSVIKQCLPSFYHQITEQDLLSKQELQICLLTRLNFPSGDIAILLNTPVQRITNAKASANSKLFSDSSATTLFKNLKHL